MNYHYESLYYTTKLYIVNKPIKKLYRESNVIFNPYNLNG